MPKNWIIRSFDREHVNLLERQAHIHPLLAQLLINRGVGRSEQVAAFLQPKLTDLRPPAQLPGCVETARRLLDAIRNDRKITVYGDYDVDGMTATAILRQVIRMLGGQVDYYVPTRMTEGYGLNHDAIRSLAAQGTQVMITVDCGINSIDEAQTARELGVELLITDHHTPGETLPDAAAITHPMIAERFPQYGPPYPFPHLSGSTVALKVAWALCQEGARDEEPGMRDFNTNPPSLTPPPKVTPEMREFLMQAVGLAALGAVADVMPLIDENRALVRFALERSLPQYAPVGLRELMKVSKIDPAKPMTSEQIAFAIGPRLNAAGRLGLAQLGVELLVTDKPDKAAELAAYINNLNETRQKLERDIVRSATKQIEEQFSPDDPAYVLASTEWHSGIIGIVAGRLSEKYHRPVVLISKDKFENKPGVGSGRSVRGLNLCEAFAACSEYLVRSGGHAAAAGLGVEDGKIDLFRDAFCEYVASELPPELRTAELVIDAEFPFSAFDTDMVRRIDSLAPFGHGNTRPVICTRGVTLAEPPKTMGSDQRHFSATLRQHQQTMRAVAFGVAEWVEQMLRHDGPIDVAFHPVINEFRGFAKVELQLIDWKPAE
ncbi:MAG: single-stranded-DNA-specific exonuclease RecJ [Planctomycetaceae bacterium]|nr:single-stranded-DNA-specific exonuclease RecJ [Planctomycetaceae bacterium]